MKLCRIIIAVGILASQAQAAEIGHFNGGVMNIRDYLVPDWLGKTLTHWDFAFGYGFYAPVGKYDTDTVTISGVGL